MQIQEILYKGIKELKSQEIEEASLISKILLADILKCKREELINIAENNLNEKEENEFLSGIDRIKEGYPLEYITGKKEFMKMEFFVNENSNKKILTLENPVEYKHTCKKSVIVQKEIGLGRDCLTFSDGVKNSLREDCDILVIGEIRDRETMEAAIETAEAGHLVIGTLHTKSCAETIDRMVNFYDIRDQQTVKYLIS